MIEVVVVGSGDVGHVPVVVRLPIAVSDDDQKEADRKDGSGGQTENGGFNKAVGHRTANPDDGRHDVDDEEDRVGDLRLDVEAVVRLRDVVEAARHLLAVHHVTDRDAEVGQNAD